MIIICKFLTRPIPSPWLGIPMFMPPVLATLFAVLLTGEAAAPVAYIFVVLGTLIGGDLLKPGQGKEAGRRYCLHRWCHGSYIPKGQGIRGRRLNGRV